MSAGSHTAKGWSSSRWRPDDKFETHRLTVADEHIYVDDGISGAEFANRPGFLRLMNALKPSPPFQALIMSEESRLGREAIETAYALKQIITSGVRVFFYLEDRERTLENPTDKILLSLTTFADELEREKARQRTYDALLRKARAGQVTGGVVFGYTNMRTDGAGVTRQINESEASVVRDIFQLCATGLGVRGIAKRLNERGVPRPRPQQGRPAGWAPSSVWSVLRRPLYRGEVVWGRTKKRDKWGQQRRTTNAEDSWVRVEVPELRIVPEPLWQAVQKRLVAGRRRYLTSTGGDRFGRPPNHFESKYLLTGLVRCGDCGSNLVIRSRSHGRRRAYFYACSAFHHRGRHVCGNSLEVARGLAEDTILTEIERYVLHPKVVDRAIRLALTELESPAGLVDRERARLQGELQAVERELGRLTGALASGASALASVIEALQDREGRRHTLRTSLAGLEHIPSFSAKDAEQLESMVRDKLADWRALLRGAPQEARQILRALLTERLTFEPTEKDGHRLYRYRGIFTVGALFAGEMCPQMLASPRGPVDILYHEYQLSIAAAKTAIRFRSRRYRSRIAFSESSVSPRCRRTFAQNPRHLYAVDGSPPSFSTARCNLQSKAVMPFMPALRKARRTVW